MKTAAFCSQQKEDDTVDETDATCIRLRCGHAFHASCTLASFRSGTGCPMCRDAVDEEEVLDDPVFLRLDMERERIRASCSSVKAARRELNKSMRDYKAHTTILRAERKLFIRKALEDFSRKRRTEFTKITLSVTKKLKVVEIEETKELQKHATEEELEDYMEAIAYEYDGKEYMRSNDFACADPIQKSFWKA